MPRPKPSLPLVYSCSGCSSAAQTANHIALELDRRGIAEMSCIAGVGGDVKPLVAKARSGRAIVAIDGCALHCVRHVLAKQELKPALCFNLAELGVKKRDHGDFSAEEAQAVLSRVRKQVRTLGRRDDARGAKAEIP